MIETYTNFAFLSGQKEEDGILTVRFKDEASAQACIAVSLILHLILTLILLMLILLYRKIIIDSSEVDQFQLSSSTDQNDTERVDKEFL